MNNKYNLKQQALFLLLEGIDGSGKSTAAQLLCKQFTNLGLKSVVLSEPTQGEYGRELRTLLAKPEPDNERLLELFIKDRVEDMRDNIKPALERGEIVILDRYYYSNAAYQADTFEEAEIIVGMNRSNQLPEPDRIYYLDITPDNALKRIHSRKDGTRKECFDDLTRLTDIYKRYTHVLPASTLVINALQTPDNILNDILEDISLYQGEA